MEGRKTIQFRVTQSQYERIMLKIENAGYQYISQFLRDLLLKEDLGTEKMIREIHQKVIGIEAQLKKEEKNEKGEIGL